MNLWMSMQRKRKQVTKDGLAHVVFINAGEFFLRSDQTLYITRVRGDFKFRKLIELLLGETRLLHPVENGFRSEEHTSELQSHSDLVCRLLLEKKKKK